VTNGEHLHVFSQTFVFFRFVDIIVITFHDRFWNVGQANCILKYFKNMMIDHSDSTIFYKMADFICEFLFFLNTTLFYYFMLPVKRYLAMNIGVWLITKNRIAYSYKGFALYYNDFKGYTSKLHALLGHPVSENFVSGCQTLKNSSASFLCIQETYNISTISQFESD
jgi:hypothetical protein